MQVEHNLYKCVVLYILVALIIIWNPPNTDGCHWEELCDWHSPDCAEINVDAGAISESHHYVLDISDWHLVGGIHVMPLIKTVSGSCMFAHAFVGYYYNEIDKCLELWVYFDRIGSEFAKMLIVVGDGRDDGEWSYYMRYIFVDLPTQSGAPPVATFKSLNVLELGRSDEETYDGEHMAGGSIRFDPTASYDEDGQIVSYEWNFDNGTKFSTDAPNIYDVVFQEARIYNVTLTVTDNVGLTNTYAERLDLSLKEGDLIFIRTAWWNIPFNIVGNEYTHVGMYTGGQWMIESILTGITRSSGISGVVQTPVSGWAYPSETFATLVRVKTANDKIRRMAVAYAQSKLGQEYDIFVNKKSVTQRNYYCSELIWAAYYKASKSKIDLGNRRKKRGVWPDHIINDPVNTQVIGYHWEHHP